MNFNQIETLDCFIFYGSKSKRGWNSSNREVLHRLVLRAQKGEKHTPVRVWRQSSAQQSPCLHCCLSALAGCLTAPVELEVLIQWEAQRGNCPPPHPRVAGRTWSERGSDASALLLLLVVPLNSASPHR